MNIPIMSTLNKGVIMFGIFKRNNFLIVSILALVISPVANADMFEPSPSCSKPYKPYQFNNQYEVDNFNNDVQRYKECINDFVEEQNDAIRTHSNAAEAAIEEWNNFVNYELN
ncbi:hypothetical protein AB4369_20810 [Vibrio sp. 10N.261.49.A5]|nr:hypothetical protein [Vibrio splendidus]MDH5939882.1 hypothetical protein [Vibrio splendidus]